MSRPTPEELEQFIHRTLRSLPDRRAPRSLEARVLTAIAARQALPWWRQSFVHWPLAARGAFLLVSAVLAAAFVALGLRLAGDVQPAAMLEQPLGVMAQARAVAAGIGDFGALVLRSIPPLWIYGLLAFVATLYAALFGLGAAAYRSFFVQR